VSVIGKENIPKDKPVIFAINHQNTLMDALVVIGTVKGQTVFMARADIFQSGFVATLLRFIKILPIFRIRDGIKNLQNNDAVFEEAVGVLEGKSRLAILPEGSHLGQRRLRILKKGIARIAFQAEERNNFELDVCIVPIGLDYTDYINFGAKVLVNIGKPFYVKEFREQYEANNQKGMNAFLKKTREIMLSQMLHIDDSEDYKKIEISKDIYVQHLLVNKELEDNHLEVLKKSQIISDKLVELKKQNYDNFEKMGVLALGVNKAIKKLKIRNWVPAVEKYSWFNIIVNFIILLLFSPLFVIGFTLNYLPFQLPVIASKKIKDPQFLSSIRFGVSLFSFLIIYVIYLILLFIFTDIWYIPFIAILGIYILGIISFRYYILLKKTISKFKVNIWNITKNRDWKELRKDWNAIVKIIETC
jgi:1-acyl-sn-glycerol-3-phosphate acyltransferase